MDNARTVETQQAQANPNILSPLYGANVKTSAPLSPQQSYQAAQGAGQEVADKLYGSGQLKALSGNIDQQLQDLYNYDKTLETGHDKIYPQYPWYVDNPTDAYRTGGQIAQQTSSNVGKTQSAVGAIDTSYKNAVSGVIDKFVEFAKIQESRRQAEDTSKAKEQDRQDQLLQWILNITGGQIKNPVTGEMVNVPSEAARSKSTGSGVTAMKYADEQSMQTKLNSAIQYLSTDARNRQEAVQAYMAITQKTPEIATDLMAYINKVYPDPKAKITTALDDQAVTDYGWGIDNGVITRDSVPKEYLQEIDLRKAMEGRQAANQQPASQPNFLQRLLGQ